MKIEHQEFKTFGKIDELTTILNESIRPTDKHVLAELIATYHGMLEQYYSWWRKVCDDLHKLRAQESDSN